MFAVFFIDLRALQGSVRRISGQNLLAAGGFPIAANNIMCIAG